MSAQLTGCTNCMKLFIDTNPDKQPEFEIPQGVYDLPTIEDKDGSGLCRGCDDCETDGCLMDIETEDQLKMFTNQL